MSDDLNEHQPVFLLLQAERCTAVRLMVPGGGRWRSLDNAREKITVKDEANLAFFIEYLFHLVLLLQDNSSAGQIPYKPVKGQKVMGYVCKFH